MSGCQRCHGGWLLADDGGQGTARRCRCVSSHIEADRRQKVSELGPVRRPEDGYQPDKFPDGSDAQQVRGRPARPEQFGGDRR